MDKLVGGQLDDRDDLEALANLYSSLINGDAGEMELALVPVGAPLESKQKSKGSKQQGSKGPPNVRSKTKSAVTTTLRPLSTQRPRMNLLAVLREDAHANTKDATPLQQGSPVRASTTSVSTLSASAEPGEANGGRHVNLRDLPAGAAHTPCAERKRTKLHFPNHL
jgi:hypothetical protein